MSCAVRVARQASKRPAAVFIVREHVEALAGRRQQDAVARDREIPGPGDDVGKAAADALDRCDATQVALDEVRGFPERQNDLAPFPNGLGEAAVRLTGVTPA
jgi:hypothetical protein